MKQYKIAFYVSEKARSKEFGAMLAAGARAHGDVVDLIPQDGFTQPLEGYDGAGNLGLARAAKRLMDAYLGVGKHFLFFDKGYYSRKQYWRVSVDAWQPLAYFQRFMRPSDRMEIAGPRRLHRRKKRDRDARIVFAGACQNYTNFCELGNVNDYNLQVLRELRGNTDRKIIYRPNPSWYTKHHDEFRPIHELVENVELSPPDIPFSQELENCHLLVTHGSSATVAALSSGVPIMVLGGGVCRSLALQENQFAEIEATHWPKEEERRQFFADLAYCQWSAQEYRNGKAWAELRLVMAALSKDNGNATTKEVLDQYRLMHQHPNYFRGLTTLKYATQIGALIHQTKSETILDYGSGKGEQYKAPYYCHMTWGVAVDCYDPGVPEYSVLRHDIHDGVICCDVMEHVLEADVQAILQDVLRHAQKFVFFAIATNPATKTLPDGRNCHLTVHPREWWGNQIAKASSVVKNGRLKIELITPKE